MSARERSPSEELAHDGAQDAGNGTPHGPQPGAARASDSPENPVSDDGAYYLDLVADELSLARAQMASGLSPLAEAVLVRRIAQLHAQGDVALDELDAARALLAEALWRQVEENGLTLPQVPESRGGAGGSWSDALMPATTFVS